MSIKAGMNFSVFTIENPRTDLNCQGLEFICEVEQCDPADATSRYEYEFTIDQAMVESSLFTGTYGPVFVPDVGTFDTQTSNDIRKTFGRLYQMLDAGTGDY